MGSTINNMQKFFSLNILKIFICYLSLILFYLAIFFDKANPLLLITFFILKLVLGFLIKTVLPSLACLSFLGYYCFIVVCILNHTVFSCDILLFVYSSQLFFRKKNLSLLFIYLLFFSSSLLLLFLVLLHVFNSSFFFSSPVAVSAQPIPNINWNPSKTLTTDQISMFLLIKDQPNNSNISFTEVFSNDTLFTSAFVTELNLMQANLTYLEANLRLLLAFSSLKFSELVIDYADSNVVNTTPAFFWETLFNNRTLFNNSEIIKLEKQPFVNMEFFSNTLKDSSSRYATLKIFPFFDILNVRIFLDHFAQIHLEYLAECAEFLNRLDTLPVLKNDLRLKALDSFEPSEDMCTPLFDWQIDATDSLNCLSAYLERLLLEVHPLYTKTFSELADIHGESELVYYASKINPGFPDFLKFLEETSFIERSKSLRIATKTWSNVLTSQLESCYSFKDFTKDQIFDFKKFCMYQCTFVQDTFDILHLMRSLPHTDEYSTDVHPDLFKDKIFNLYNLNAGTANVYLSDKPLLNKLKSTILLPDHIYTSLYYFEEDENPRLLINSENPKICRTWGGFFSDIFSYNYWFKSNPKETINNPVCNSVKDTNPTLLINSENPKICRTWGGFFSDIFSYNYWFKSNPKETINNPVCNSVKDTNPLIFKEIPKPSKTTVKGILYDIITLKYWFNYKQ